MIDAGSSGSRAYLYGWPSHSGDEHQLLKIRPIVSKKKFDGNKNENFKVTEGPLVKKVTPGLSRYLYFIFVTEILFRNVNTIHNLSDFLLGYNYISFVSLHHSPEKVMEYIRPLFEFASTHIPEKYHKETSLYILATAGMRLLPKSQQDPILSNLREGVTAEYPFIFPEENLEIISGRQEGVYQWLAINYVLGKLDHHLQTTSITKHVKVQGVNSVNDDENLGRQKTVGAIDMVSLFIVTHILDRYFFLYHQNISTFSMINFGLVFQGGASMQLAMEISRDGEIDDISVNIQTSQKVIDDNLK